MNACWAKIQDAHELFIFREQNLTKYSTNENCSHYRRTFFGFQREELRGPQPRPKLLPSIEPDKSTEFFQSVKERLPQETSAVSVSHAKKRHQAKTV